VHPVPLGGRGHLAGLSAITHRPRSADRVSMTSGFIAHIKINLSERE
jgi:hypothetical protein